MTTRPSKQEATLCITLRMSVCPSVPQPDLPSKFTVCHCHRYKCV